MMPAPSAKQREALERYRSAACYLLPWKPLRGDAARTFIVRACSPLAAKLYLAAMRADPCAYCGERPARKLDTLAPHRAGAPPARPRARAAWRDARAETRTACCARCGVDKRDPDILHHLLKRLSQTTRTP